jgi:hypothetical protein
MHLTAPSHLAPCWSRSFGTSGRDATRTGAKLELEPWDGDVFTAKLMPPGRFAAVVENFDPMLDGFAQFQMDWDARLNLLHLSFEDGPYEFRRE